jgi:hypothetical protein
MLEQAIAREYHPADEMACPVHLCIGQEAAAVGVIGALSGTLIGLVSTLAYLIVFYTAGVEGAGFGAPTWASVMGGIAKAHRTSAPKPAARLWKSSKTLRIAHQQ